MTPGPLDDLLGGPLPIGGVPAQVPIVKTHTLARCMFFLEKNEESGGFNMIFDLILSPQAAERYVLPFDADGWSRFRKAIEASGSGIVPASVIPIERMQ